MAKIDFSQFHELAEQFRREITIKLLCEQEGMIEVESIRAPLHDGSSPKATEAQIVFENELTFERREMDVDPLVGFHTKILTALCFPLTQPIHALGRAPLTLIS